MIDIKTSRRQRIFTSGIFRITYAWAEVSVYPSGRVHLDAYGFDEFFGPTRLLKSMDIDQGRR